MPFSGASYDPETLAVLESAFDAAWVEVQKTLPGRSESELSVTRKMMALRIMAAANDGERDPKQLKVLAIQAVDGREFD